MEFPVSLAGTVVGQTTAFVAVWQSGSFYDTARPYGGVTADMKRAISVYFRYAIGSSRNDAVDLVVKRNSLTYFHNTILI
jgi:hypothetical protein